jgi:hypothetical protein
MKFEEVLPALRAGEGIRQDNWTPGRYWILRGDSLVIVATEGEEYVGFDWILDDKWSVVERKPVEHGVRIDGLEYARIRDGRQSALVLLTQCFTGDTLIIKDRDTREVLTAEVTHVAPVRAEVTHVAHFYVVRGPRRKDGET